MPLIVLSGDAGVSAYPDRVPEILHPGENAEPSIVTDGGELDWKSTVPTAAELLHRVRGGPLKSVAEGLCFVLENCEVQLPSLTCDQQSLQPF